ncbi:hypothetical protein [Modicisalibacter tunisiensis]|uniref:Aminoglycoside phosphotransferase domain-containing protein n=1 Tax=Modicisalibacter tunisiensis TaxID=390637 RepID=A0ABS7X1T3_9GAMM|nr:hypothetical protein [Modicisalibacter tunisiensis]MBZ9537720.1 hypothetical protein [Modicisalibacter tunisiensis]MBZ9568861.1 hypothetical protein [Modicisalibacter tunisiensis]
MPRSVPPASLSLDDKRAFLSSSSSYGITAPVEVVETHVSCVFLTPQRVYKLKKPVAWDHVDFTTLAARRANCQAEVALNRRLAAPTYLGVIALVRDTAGEWRLRREPLPGDAVLDWLVEMRRLPHGKMLDRRIAAGRVSCADLEPVVERLVELYRRAAPEPLTGAEYRGYFRRTLAEHADSLCDARLGMDRRRIRRLEAGLQAFLARCPELFEARVAAGRIVEAHGDLRPQHICLVDPPQIIDCLEFDRDLRRLDPLDELGFLAMECRRMGVAGLGKAVLAHYASLSGDSCPPTLLAFYQAYRALLRALLAAWHLLDEECRDPRHWRHKAGTYLDLAEEYLTEAGRDREALVP